MSARGWITVADYSAGVPSSECYKSSSNTAFLATCFEGIANDFFLFHLYRARSASLYYSQTAISVSLSVMEYVSISSNTIQM